MWLPECGRITGKLKLVSPGETSRSAHSEEAANRMGIDGFNRDLQQLARIRIRDSLSLTRKVQGVVRRDASDRWIEPARNFVGDVRCLEPHFLAR